MESNKYQTQPTSNSGYEIKEKFMANKNVKKGRYLIGGKKGPCQALDVIWTK